MARTLNPFMGVRNPPLVRGAGQTCRTMPKSKVLTHAAVLLREAISANFAGAVVRAYPDMPVTTAYLKIGRATGCSLSTLQRIGKGQVSPQTDTLADIAFHLGTTVRQLVSQTTPDNHLEDQPGPELGTVRSMARARRVRAAQHKKVP